MKDKLKLPRWMKRFGPAEEAVAAVEFALILPAMMILYMGAIEVSQVVTVDRKISAVAGTLGDLVARNDGQLAASTLNDYFQAVGLILTPFAANDLKQLVTLVYIDDEGDTNIVWSVGYNGATPKIVDTPYTLPSEITDIAREMHVVVSEAQLAYQPWGGYVLDTSFNLYKQFFHTPRFGEEIELT
ncbi:MAG: pilus assembly protein [Devosiaceae bacterium]|nr:pilus assembly protein [Devosiaceae bacterium]